MNAEKECMQLEGTRGASILNSAPHLKSRSSVAGLKAVTGLMEVGGEAERSTVGGL